MTLGPDMIDVLVPQHPWGRNTHQYSILVELHSGPSSVSQLPAPELARPSD
jgi:hypothetical protein